MTATPANDLNRQSELRGHAAMLAFSILVSGSYSFGGTIAAEIDPTALNVIRFAIAAGVLASVAVVSGVSLRIRLNGIWRYPILGGLLAVYFITMFMALGITDPVSTSAVFTLTPLIAAGFGFVVAGQKVGPRTMSALALGGMGAVWVIFRADIGALLRFQIGKGEAIFLIGVICHAIYPVLARTFSRGEPPLQSTFWITVFGMFVMIAYGWRPLIETDYGALRPQVWMVLLYLAVVASALTFFLMFFASRVLPAGKVMAYTYLVPTWVVFLEFALHGATQPVLLVPGVLATLVALVMLLRTG